MGNLYSFCRCCVLAFVFLIPSLAFSETETRPATQENYAAINKYKISGTVLYQTPELACAAELNNYSSNTSYTWAYVFTAPSSCVINRNGAYYQGFSISPTPICENGAAPSYGYCKRYVCPDSSWTLNGQTCERPICDAGYDLLNGQCVKDCTGKQGQATANGNYQFSGASSSWAVNGCKVKCPQRVLTKYGGIGYQCYYTGASADPNTPEPELKDREEPDDIPPEEPDDCLKRGQGYVESSTGAITCVGPSDAPPGQGPKGEEDDHKEKGPPGPDGKPDKNHPDYEGETKSSRQNGDGSVTTEKEQFKNGTPDGNGDYTCPDGYQKIGDNKCSKKTSETQSQPSFCKENPNSFICKNSNFNGSCETGFTCDGEAAACATARASWELRCAFKGNSGGLLDEENLGGSEYMLNRAEAALNKDGDSDFNIASAFSDSSQAWVNFSSACPVANQTYQIGLAAVELDASIICDIGRFIRMMIHIVAYLALMRVFATKLV